MIICSRGETMKAWSKKVMTLACATCLTAGMAAVACADTIDLGYGQYATTDNGVRHDSNESYFQNNGTK